MRTELVSDRDALDALAGPWWQLLRRAPEPAPFLSPEWLLPWADELSGGARVVAMTVWDGGELVALCPFFTYDAAGARTLALTGGSVTDYRGALVDPSAPSAARELLAFAQGGHARALGDWARCDLTCLRDDDPLLGTLASAAASDDVADEDVCPVVDMGRDRDAFFAGLPHQLGPKLLRDRRRLERLGRCRWQRGDVELVPALLEALFDLHARRWATRGEPGVLADPAVQRFHRRAAAGLAKRGALRMHALSIDDRTVAVFYGFELGGRVYSYLSGFDPALASHSPGRAIIAEAMGSAIDEGACRFDFLRGGEAYKYAWGARDRRIRRRRIELAR